MDGAILVIDMLNDFFIDQRLRERRGKLCEKITDLIEWGRKNKLKIIWVRQEFKKDLSDAFLTMRKKQIHKTIEKTEGSQILHELSPQRGDFEVVKKRYSPFYNTKLDEIIKTEGIMRLILSGINTHACVRMAAIDGFQRDLDIIIAADCVDSYDKEHHDISLRYLGRDISRVWDNNQIMSQYFA
jgi:nicotinamidase-related amidase